MLVARALDRCLVVACNRLTAPALEDAGAMVLSCVKGAREACGKRCVRAGMLLDRERRAAMTAVEVRQAKSIKKRRDGIARAELKKESSN